jgi:hypothetical protein
METSAMIAAFVVWALLIGGLIFCFTRMGRGGGWED